MKLKIVLMASLMAIGTSTGRAQDISSCNSQADYIFAAWKRELTWSSLHHSYVLYRQCDDGAYAEAMSDTIVGKLANSWKDFDDLLMITEKDDSFRQFVIKHIDSTTDLAELHLVRQHARIECPSPNSKLCTDIQEASESAIRDIESEEGKK